MNTALLRYYPGQYQVAAEAAGFTRLVRQATVESGNTTDVNLVMQVGASPESVTVKAASAQIHYESHQIDGIIARPQIEGLPLNGRNFLELAKLEPGAQQPTRTSNNRTLVPLLGSPVGQNGRATRVTVDGGSIMEVGNGGSAMGFSEESVEEFQVSTVNFDLSTGATASGAVNVATRSGTNELHGGGFLFFRDHHLSAYPALERDPFNPDPFFQRRQYGLSLGGPIRKDRAFFFGTFERTRTARCDQHRPALTGLCSAEWHLSQPHIRKSVRRPDGLQTYPKATDVRALLARRQLLLCKEDGGQPSTWPRQSGMGRPEHCGVDIATRRAGSERPALLLFFC